MKNYVFYLLIISLACPVLRAEKITKDSDKLAIIEKIKQADKKIKSFHIQYSSDISTESETEPNETQKQYFEWAKSGEKLFLKKQLGEESQKRFQIGLWDGKYYKLFDTLTKSGSLRDKYQVGSRDDAPYNLRGLAYSRFSGKFSGESLLELFDIAPLKYIVIDIADDDSKLILTINTVDYVVAHKWIMIPDKNYVVEEYEYKLNDRNTNEYKTIVTQKALEIIEAKPGIWIQNKVTASSIQPDDTIRQEQFELDLLKVNEPSIEEVFKWDFPADGESTYYDYTLERSVKPGVQ